MPVTLDFLTPTIDALVRATLDFTCAARVANAAVSRAREATGGHGLTAIDDARTPEHARYLAALPAELRELETSCPRRRAVAELAAALPALWAALDALDAALIAAAPLLDDARAPLADRRTNRIRGVALRAAAPYAVARALPDPTGFFALRAIVGDAPLERSAAALGDLDAVRFELLAARESPATVTANQAAAAAADTLAGFAPADTLALRHGISAAALARAKQDGKVRWRPAPAGMLDSQGRAVRVLYCQADALEHCAPKRRPRCGLSGALGRAQPIANRA